MKNPVNERNASEAIFESLTQRIASGELLPGAKLAQDEIAQTYGVSHIPVRSAFLLLAQRGYATMVPNRGCFVAQMSLSEALELQRIRTSLEVLAGQQAITRIGRAALEVARFTLEDASASRDVNAWSELNWRFHRALYEPCAMPRLMNYLDLCWSQCDRYLRLVWQAETYQPHSETDHENILQTFQKGDWAEAEPLICRHIDDATAVMTRLLARQQPPM